MAIKFIIGIDLGGTNLKIALLDSRYKILAKEILHTGQFRKKEALIQAIVEAVKKFLKSREIQPQAILGIGLGLPGPIDVRRGLVHFFPNIPGWKNVSLKNILQKKIGIPVFLDNDANLMSLAEHRLGAAKGVVNAVCLTLGTGVGGGIIINSNLYRAEGFAAGEIGHMPLNEKGSRCNCGGRACLERYIGNRRIEEKARRIFRRSISLEELSSLAERGNKKAKVIWQEAGSHLGIALAGIINLLNPDVIVIGGGVAGAGKILFDQVKKVVLERSMPVQARHVKIRKAALGNDAGIIGAAILVKEGARK